MEQEDNIGNKAIEMTAKIFSIMTNPEEISHDDMLYIVNNALPMVELLKNATHHRLVTLGVEETESMTMLTALSRMSMLAGGVSLADFSITEKMAKDSTK